MTMLIGIYLLQVQPIDLGRSSGKHSWAASWTLFRSPSGGRDDWEPLTQRETPSTFTDEADACRAAMEQGLDFARRLQRGSSDQHKVSLHPTIRAARRRQPRRSLRPAGVPVPIGLPAQSPASPAPGAQY